MAPRRFRLARPARGGVSFAPKAKGQEKAMRLKGIVLMLLALGACTGGDRASGGGSGLQEVSMRSSDEVVVPPGRETLALAVRSFVSAGEAWNEVTGARCHVTGGAFFSADVVTPARLTVQDLGPDAPPLTAECESGTLRGADQVLPAFGWPAETRPAAPQRIWRGRGWWWGYQKTGPMRYPDLAVALR